MAKPGRRGCPLHYLAPHGLRLAPGHHRHLPPGLPLRMSTRPAHWHRAHRLPVATPLFQAHRLHPLPKTRQGHPLFRPCQWHPLHPEAWDAVAVRGGGDSKRARACAAAQGMRKRMFTGRSTVGPLVDQGMGIGPQEQEHMAQDMGPRHSVVWAHLGLPTSTWCASEPTSRHQGLLVRKPGKIWKMEGQLLLGRSTNVGVVCHLHCSEH